MMSGYKSAGIDRLRTCEHVFAVVGKSPASMQLGGSGERRSIGRPAERAMREAAIGGLSGVPDRAWHAKWPTLGLVVRRG
jgi:hypothetical protein